MKLNGVFGKGTGKVGNSVWAVSGGVQIVRPYNPNVSNPNTDAQVEQRAKLKLMSQIAASLAPAIAFKKKGLVSARNQFISANIGKCTFENNQASIAITSIDLTGSVTPLPDFEATKGEANAIAVNLLSGAAQNVDAIVYVAVKQTPEFKLEIIDSKVVTTPDDDRTFGTTLQGSADEVVVYAYGIISASNTSRVSYENYIAHMDDDAAQLAVVSSLLLAGANTSITKVKSVPA